MGLLNRLFNWTSRKPETAPAIRKKTRIERQRRCLFEVMEPRQMMDADPIKLGVTYHEGDSGSDKHGDTFEIKFEGGDAGTELTHLEINGDHGPAGLSFGDMIFDTVKGGLGADEAFAFSIVSQGSIQQVHYTVVDGSSIIKFDFVGFKAGDKLVFSIDVDEVQDYDPSQTDLETINQGIDPIASGVEFHGSKLTATFKEPHNYDVTGTKEFRNVYDPQFLGTNLLITANNPDGLPYDDYNGQRDRSTGVMLPLQQTPLPITIAGRVYLEKNLDLHQDAGEPGLNNVTLSLWKKQGNSYLDTGFTTTTNGQGDYEFGANLNLTVGIYQVRETQPLQYYSVGAIPGNVSGTATGSTVPGNLDVLTEINIPRGGLDGVRYDFAEAEPSTLRGHVHLTDRDGNCHEDGIGSPTPIAGVVIDLRDAQGNVIATTTTDENGAYEFVGLRGGNYSIFEHQPDGLLDGDEDPGTIGGVKVGTILGDDLLGQITLGPGQHGINYDFCEHEPGMISGYVYYDKNNNGLFEGNETPIPEATVRLLNSSGVQIATTTTDANGFYKFNNLVKDIYCVVEDQPAAYRDGLDTPGTIGGATVGQAVNPGDKIKFIDLRWGDTGIEYNFGELLPGSIAGQVYVDHNGDCIRQDGEDSLAGVTIQLMDAGGSVLLTTTTDSNGQYHFDNLTPGVYTVRELQPVGYLQGGQVAGSGGGNATVQDVLSQIPIGAGDDLVNYDFCEQLPVSISGLVFVDNNHDCLYDPGEIKLSGVKIHLFDENGTEIASTLTDSQGRYSFDNLLQGTYTVVEDQPAAYLDGGQMAGNFGGDDSGTNEISNVFLVGGSHGVEYNFCEVPAGSISGFVFRDGPAIQTADNKVPDNLYSIRDGKLTPDDLRIGGVYLELRHTLTGDPVTTDEVLPGIYGYSGALRTVTNSSGYYEFLGLPQGNYTVIEIQPKDYYDGIDTAGDKGGLAVNKNTFVSSLTVQTFALAGVKLNDDAILQIPLGAGQHSVLNNFSEVQVVTQGIPWNPPPPPAPPPAPPGPLPLNPLPIVKLPPPPPTPEPEPIIGGGGANYTWHLSVVDAGLPRLNGKGTKLRSTAFRSVLHVERINWRPESLQSSQWRLDQGDSAQALPDVHFGIPGATPVTGDWDGDGTSEVGLYYEGEWFLDLNGNGHWDKEDLWAKLGTAADLPVVGDWDGDGKDDIGIFGPEWEGDPRHLQYEPGLPDPQNGILKPRPKNVPPEVEQATDGDRLLRLTSQGNERADLIDHVFRFGQGNDLPIAGDWNGDGISTIGVFRAGKWTFDVDGDGKLTRLDETATFGQKGDLPVIGDFDGDGIDEIGVYRAGKWTIDSNHNRQIDATDHVFQFGGADDRPVVGDFNGDGVDELGLYREGTNPTVSE